MCFRKLEPVMRKERKALLLLLLQLINKGLIPDVKIIFLYSVPFSLSVLLLYKAIATLNSSH